MSMRNKQRALYPVLAAVLFGASTPAAKALLADISPWLLAGLLYLGSGIGLLGVRLGAKGLGFTSPEAPLRGKDWLWLGGSTCFGGIIAPLLLMVGLNHSDAAAAALLLNLEGVFTALLAWFLFKENFDRRIALGMVAIVGGSLLLSWSGVPGAQGLLGPACIAGACLAWSLDNNVTKKIAASDAAQITTIKGLVAGLTNTALFMVVGAGAWPPAATVATALVVGFFGYGASLIFFVLGLRHLGAARTGAYFSLAPFVGAAIALATGASWSWQIGGAAVLMACGVWLHLSERHEHVHEHQEMDHEHLHVHDEHHRHEHAPGDPPGEPHSHRHHHGRLVHRHEHFPDLHHTHTH